MQSIVGGRTFIVAGFLVGSAWTAAADTWATNGPFGSSVTVLAADRTAPGTVYTGTSGGLFKSIDGGAAWTLVRGGLPATAIYDVAIAPSNPLILFVSAELPTALGPGTSGRGLFKSVDGGANWVPLRVTADTDFSPYPVAIDPTNPFIAYVPGYRTSDGGAKWTPLATTASGIPVTPKIAIDPADPRTLFSFSLGSDGLYTLVKSTDSGASWNFVIVPPFSTVLPESLALDAGPPTTIYVHTVGFFSGLVK